MASTINAKTTGTGGIEYTGDASGNVAIQSDGTTVLNTTASGVEVTGTLQNNNVQVATQNVLGVRNLIINGDMRIAQRGTSQTGLVSGNNFLIDRWLFNLDTTGTWTYEQDTTDVPTGQGFVSSLKLSCTTANASITGTKWMNLQHRFEAQFLQHLKWGTASAESLTLTFWVKSNKTGTYTLSIYKSEGTAYGISKEYTIDTADTWEKKTISIDAHTIDVIANDNGDGMRIYWVLDSGPDRKSSTLQTSWGVYDSTAFISPSQATLADSTSNYLNITGVQLEVGDTATPFEHRPYDVELARCQRYYEKSYAVTTAPAGSDYYIQQVNPLNRGGGTGAVGYPIYYKVTKRANPTVTPYTYDGTSGQWHTGVIGSSEAKGNATIEDAGTNFFKVVVLYSTAPNAIYGHWVSSSEL